MIFYFQVKKFHELESVFFLNLIFFLIFVMMSFFLTANSTVLDIGIIYGNDNELE